MYIEHQTNFLYVSIFSRWVLNNVNLMNQMKKKYSSHRAMDWFEYPKVNPSLAEHNAKGEFIDQFSGVAITNNNETFIVAAPPILLHIN